MNHKPYSKNHRKTVQAYLSLLAGKPVFPVSKPTNTISIKGKQAKDGSRSAT